MTANNFTKSKRRFWPVSAPPTRIRPSSGRSGWRGLGHEPGDAVCFKLGRAAFLTQLGVVLEVPCGPHARMVAKMRRRERAYLKGQLGLPDHRRALGLTLGEISRRLYLP